MKSESIKILSGIGDKTEKIFNRLGIYTVSDMLSFYPRNYEDRTTVKEIKDIKDGETALIKIRAVSVMKSRRIRRGMSIQKMTVTDLTGVVYVTWFNQDWLPRNMHYDEEYYLYGKFTVKNHKLELNSPSMERCDRAELCVLPIYPLTAGLNQNTVRKAVKSAIEKNGTVTDFLPGEVREKYTLCGMDYAIDNIHFPTDFKKLGYARTRLAFNELFLMQLGIRMLKERKTELVGTPFTNTACGYDFIKTLPYEMTGAQKRVLSEIFEDLQKTKPMNRLVQGDVGCGKTAVAATAMLCAVRNGHQAAMMAPTEILAKQHFETLTDLYKNENINVLVLTGSMTAVQNREAYAKIKSGEANVIVGTHALIQQGVEFSDLAFVVTDEQHRFGVKQRAALSGKGTTPHTLVMTAKPIPRTLALILYGDLDVSAIDEMPPGRKPVETYPVDESMRGRINKFMLKNIDEGRQIYIVCPLVEESDTMDLKSVSAYTEELQKTVFKNHTVRLIHGKLKAKEKNEIMTAFENGDIDVLVSTTVIEVGVNVPNASIMVIENAERFGLSQLHQLRGRVGRGEYQSYCILFCQTDGEIAQERMNIMKATNDGFKISEKDLELRGPGEFFGTRQHGLPELRVANIYTDTELLKISGELANKTVSDDPYLKKPENNGIRAEIIKMFGENDIFNFN